MAGIARPELIATPEWLAENLGRPDLRVLDVRWRPDGTARRCTPPATCQARSTLTGGRPRVADRGRRLLLLAAPERMAAAMSAPGWATGRRW